ncbi:formate/nitrite transporter family protein [Marinicrinis sediminis]|uniref:Formate/nitrite transporter family protein n=1 Tax=Marinicrinis sediminis TaxID=1652465 RepID=A0ABW5R9Y9_9BACL
MNNLESALLQVEELALKKRKILNTSWPQFMLRAIIASMFIGMGVVVAFTTGDLFYQVHSPWAYPLAAFTFGGAIILIAYGGGDLFTGNTFYFTYAALRKRSSWIDAIKLWLFSYTGNLIGAFLFAFLILAAGLFAHADADSMLMVIVAKKMTAPTMELFFRGILCNWMVCLAFFIPMTQQGDGAKMFTMMLYVFGFFISGYEHSIANMASFAIALVSEHPDKISMAGFVHNIIPVTLGNLVGGGLFMGAVYAFINRKKSEPSPDA